MANNKLMAKLLELSASEWVDETTYRRVVLEALADIYALLNGNGAPGVIERAAMHERRWQAVFWIGGPVVTFLALAALSFLGGVLTGRIQILFT